MLPGSYHNYMNYRKNLTKKLLLSTFTLFSFTSVSAFDNSITSRYFNGPTVSSITDTSAHLSLAPEVLYMASNEEESGIYFEYQETAKQVCVAIYPAPEGCLPSKTEVGKRDVTITNLKPSTAYTVTYKRDNTIRCITTPCPTNNFTSASVEFTTKGIGSDALVPTITKYLIFGKRGSEVTLLQTFLNKQGYLPVSATGYYGSLTVQAVKKFQSAHNISATGTVGPITRALLATMISVSSSNATTEVFEGVVTAYSTACFSDGVCSISVDGKKVVTTVGWSQQTVGQVKGIPDFGSIANNVGAHAKVYAMKAEDGYTLYGSSDYYVQITPTTKGKLPAGSEPAGDLSTLKSSAWLWQKTTQLDGTTVMPNQKDRFAVSLSEDGKVMGTTDCNAFFGSYTLASDGIFSFGPLGSTKMYCEGSQENIFTAYLGKVSSVRIDTEGQLLLKLSGGEGTMYFSKK